MNESKAASDAAADAEAPVAPNVLYDALHTGVVLSMIVVVNDKTNET